MAAQSPAACKLVLRLYDRGSPAKVTAQMSFAPAGDLLATFAASFEVSEKAVSDKWVGVMLALL